jgi:hypothetical protein
MAEENYTCTFYLKRGMTVTVEITDPDKAEQSLVDALNRFYRRGLFRKVPSVVKLHGTPDTFILIENIDFFTIQKSRAVK